MRLVFADAVYYIAIIIPTDRFHGTALDFDDTDVDLRIVTSDAILMEVLAYVAARGPHLRSVALGLVDDLRSEPRVTVVRQTPELFDTALDLYRRRPDKAYSLADCMSMVICADQGISEVLTHDRHFAQEGLTILL